MTLKYLFSKLLNRLHPTALKNCNISKTAKVGFRSNFINVKVGKYTYFGNNNSIHNAEFGAFCSVASFCAIGGGEHPINYVSTSPIFYSKNNIFKKKFSNYSFNNDKKTIIGNDVWIGENVFIKSGISIGNGAIIGAHSVVTKDVPAYAIVVGNPARIIKYRFNDSIIKIIEDSEWWSWSINKIEKFFAHVYCIEDFIEATKGGN